MKKSKKSMIAVLSALLFLTVIVVPGLYAAGDIKITGTVTEDGNLKADNGDEYTIADNDRKDELMENAGKKVSVTGTVTESGGEKSIAVTSFEVMGK